jgi:EPS-associated MarR family transcriptional regulator
MQPQTNLDILRRIENFTSQKKLAEALGFSLGKMHYCLTGLMDKGLIKAERFVNSKNKAAYRYILTPSGFKEKLRLTEFFLERKRKEYDELVVEQQLHQKEGDYGKYYSF